ncbi:hypothetical protein KPL47_05220 [Clostridium estertheticum]|uniref:hypothetical protein n=1 Tax=Clostridium estertheticum TaxID=238834 RepID=UPI001C0DEC5F|nr:hypothetical protein [Clostridium estertheticum]MBU3175763.1 hypothetical protein [Clostridium estertheticum]
MNAREGKSINKELNSDSSSTNVYNSDGHKVAYLTLKSDGYHYIDWNDLTGDVEGQNIPVDKLLANLKKNTEGKGHVVILMHDLSTKATTVQALPKVIDYLKSKGYSFKKLS